ncbi:hypothetical protein BHE74_00041402 [Ensete ventricosum]|nr:hypothetical protein BHE74_00041402 [Ensete ventricosum]
MLGMVRYRVPCVGVGAAVAMVKFGDDGGAGVAGNFGNDRMAQTPERVARGEEKHERQTIANRHGRKRSQTVSEVVAAWKVVEMADKQHTSRGDVREMA